MSRRVTTVEPVVVAVLIALTACGASGSSPAVEPGPDVAGDVIDGPVAAGLTRFEVAGATLVETPATAVAPDGVDGEVPCRSFTLAGPTFESNRAELTEAGRAVVEALVASLDSDRCVVAGERPCPPDRLGVALAGHTDDRPTGRPGGNDQLSRDRADAVAAVLVAAGVEVVAVEGFGDRRPRAAVRRANRRVDVELLCRLGRGPDGPSGP